MLSLLLHRNFKCMLTDHSKLQLDVCYFNQWWRHLVNVYEVEAVIWCNLQVKLCDPYLSALNVILYKSTYLYPLPLLFRCVRLAEASMLVSFVDRTDVMEGLERKSRVSGGRRASRRWRHQHGVSPVVDAPAADHKDLSMSRDRRSEHDHPPASRRIVRLIRLVC